jgi:hypothetical protein
MPMIGFSDVDRTVCRLRDTGLLGCGPYVSDNTISSASRSASRSAREYGVGWRHKETAPCTGENKKGVVLSNKTGPYRSNSLGSCTMEVLSVTCRCCSQMISNLHYHLSRLLSLSGYELTLYKVAVSTEIKINMPKL